MNARLFTVCTALTFTAPGASAANINLRCEFWHGLLGQLQDQTYLIDLDAKTCNGQPCKISDLELVWQQQGGREDFRINRVSGEGSVTHLSNEIGALKSCRALVG